MASMPQTSSAKPIYVGSVVPVLRHTRFLIPQDRNDLLFRKP
jgi:hypothetical protein